MNNGILIQTQSPIAMPYRLLGVPNPIASINPTGFDIDAERYIIAVENADRQPLENAVRNAINSFVIGCKEDGIWSAIMQCGILMGARTVAGAIVPLVGGTCTNQNLVSGDYNRRTGFVGNASNKTINTPLAGDAMPIDRVHMSVFVTATDTSAGRMWLQGGVNGTSQTGLYTARARLRDINQNFIPIGYAVGLNAASRTTSAQNVISYRVAGSSGSFFFVTPVAPSSQTFSILSGTSGRVAFYSIGTSINMALLETRVSTLYTAIGLGVIL